MLTDQTVRSLKPPPKGNIIKYDSGPRAVPGFGIRITANGVLSFVLSYRTKTMQARRLTIGRYPTWSVTKARTKAAEYRRAVDVGADPLQERRDALQAVRDAKEQRLTFGELAEEFLQSVKSGPKAHKDGGKVARGRLTSNFTDLWDRQAGELTTAELKERLQQKAEETPAMAEKLRILLGQVYQWGMKELPARVTDNPVQGIDRLAKGKERERTLTPEEIERFWKGLEATEIPAATIAVLRFALVTGQRIGECCGLEWTEISDGGKWWTVPGSKRKNGKSHRVPLSDMAREILDAQLQHETGPVFRGARDRAVRPEKVSVQFHHNRDTLNLGDARVHDLRRTCASGMASLEVRTETVAAVLGHTPKGVTEAVYVKHSKDSAKRQALDRWARHLQAIIDGQPAGKVVAIDG